MLKLTATTAILILSLVSTASAYGTEPIFTVTNAALTTPQPGEVCE